MEGKKRTDTKVYADLERSFENNSQEAQNAKAKRRELEAELAASESAAQRIEEAEKRKVKAQADSAKVTKEIKTIQTQINKQNDHIGESKATYDALTEGIGKTQAEVTNLTTELNN
jgi:chromosome segregation ATPase